MDRNLSLEALRITESGALAAAQYMGKGDEAAADQAAAQAMHGAFRNLDMVGTVVIGDADRETRSLLYAGERLGNGQGPRIDVAVDPLEGNTLCANGRPNALSIVALAEEGGLLSCPNVYMEKIAVGADLRHVIDLDQSPSENLHRVAEAKDRRVEDLTVVMLYRPRHEALIRAVREAGARVKLLSDGDVAAAIATTKAEAGIDALMGIGGAPQGILAAAALRCLGGYMEARLKPRNAQEVEQCRAMGVHDLQRKFSLEELAGGEVLFAATGVTNGEYLRGVRFFPDGAKTESVVMCSKTRTRRVVNTTHYGAFKPDV